MAAAFLMEIRRGTQSALLLLRAAAELPSAPVEVSVGADSLEVRSGGSCDAAALPAGVRLAPSSCRGLRLLRGDGLHLRMRLLCPPPAADVLYPLRESLKPNKNYVLYCQSCGDVVVKDRKFLRVLPLPSENWSDLVEEWCCHPDPFTRRTLHPQHGDCFVGDTFFLLNSGNESHVPESPVWCSEAGHHASQSGSYLKSKENTRLICKRCKTMLGETVSSDTTKYYVTEVVIQPAEGSFSPTPRSQFVQSMVAQCLLELSSAKSTFRFTIKGDNGKTYILIWLLNSDTLLVESLGSSSSHSNFTLFGDILTPNSGPVGTWNAVKVLYQPCIQCRNKDQRSKLCCGVWELFWELMGRVVYCDAHSSEEHYQPIFSSKQRAVSFPVLKVRQIPLYRKTMKLRLADAWENDMGVHPLKFPSETCLELLLILSLSTTSLPPSLQCMNSFQDKSPILLKSVFVFDLTGARVSSLACITYDSSTEVAFLKM